MASRIPRRSSRLKTSSPRHPELSPASGCKTVYWMFEVLQCSKLMDQPIQCSECVFFAAEVCRTVYYNRYPGRDPNILNWKRLLGVSIVLHSDSRRYVKLPLEIAHKAFRAEHRAVQSCITESENHVHVLRERKPSGAGWIPPPNAQQHPPQ